MAQCSKCYAHPPVSEEGLSVCRICNDALDWTVGDISGTDWVITTVSKDGSEDYLYRDTPYAKAKMEWSKMPDVLDSHFLRAARPDEVEADEQDRLEAAVAETQSKRQSDCRAARLGTVIEVLVLGVCSYAMLRPSTSRTWFIVVAVIAGLVVVDFILASVRNAFFRMNGRN